MNIINNKIESVIRKEKEVLSFKIDLAELRNNPLYQYINRGIGVFYRVFNESEVLKAKIKKDMDEQGIRTGS